ncbi:MAG: trehalose-phosphatase [Acidimicrobiia bacterium]
MGVAAVFDGLLRDPARSAVVADFDGSLAPIVADPASAVALSAALSALEGLVSRFGTVAVVSGRPATFLAERIPVEGLTLVGQYGLERFVDGSVVVDPSVRPFLPAITQVADDAEHVWPDLHVERKGGLAVTLHWRGAPEQGENAAAWADATAARLGLDVVPGRMAREFRAGVPIDKGTVLETLVTDCDAALFAGDDHGDLAAFDALDRLEASGALSTAVRVGVASDEGPAEIRARADVVVDGPAGLASLLADLVSTLPPFVA